MSNLFIPRSTKRAVYDGPLPMVGSSLPPIEINSKGDKSVVYLRGDDQPIDVNREHRMVKVTYNEYDEQETIKVIFLDKKATIKDLHNLMSVGRDLTTGVCNIEVQPEYGFTLRIPDPDKLKYKSDIDAVYRLFASKYDNSDLFERASESLAFQITLDMNRERKDPKVLGITGDARGWETASDLIGDYMDVVTNNYMSRYMKGV
ncbi:ORF43 [Ostreid herpesvirus 1]|nr:ORF43 [Ostreid herpesvirus 1]